MDKCFIEAKRILCQTSDSQKNANLALSNRKNFDVNLPSELVYTGANVDESRSKF